MKKIADHNNFPDEALYPPAKFSEISLKRIACPKNSINLFVSPTGKNNFFELFKKNNHK